MYRRNFSKEMMLAGAVIPAINQAPFSASSEEALYKEETKNHPVRDFDVVVAGGGAADVVAAIAA